VNIVELIAFNLEVYLTFGVLYGAVSTVTPDETQWQDNRAGLEQLVTLARTHAQSASMQLVVQQADEILAALQRPVTSAAEAFSITHDLLNRFKHYLEGRTAFMIPESGKCHFDSPTAGWEAVIAKFPASLDNIEEASRCLALGRHTACVYHLSGVVQDALEALGRRLGVKLDPMSDTWNTIIVKVDKAIAANTATTPKKSWKKREVFYSELVSDIRAMKNAWRNPTMHFRRNYTDEQATKVYLRVQEFMIQTATELHGKSR
jgi:hypothetical protein